MCVYVCVWIGVWVCVNVREYVGVGWVVQCVYMCPTFPDVSS